MSALDVYTGRSYAITARPEFVEVQKMHVPPNSITTLFKRIEFLT